MFDQDTILKIRSLPFEKIAIFWETLEEEGKESKNLPGVVKALCKADLYYLLVKACRRVDLLHPWFFERVREVEANPNGYIDLWAREHGKSSIITFGLTIWDILNDPEVTFGFFSHTRPIAKAFLRQIMREFESNKVLHAAFPDILWGEDIKQSPKWSEDDGIIVKRKSNPNEATIEAWGLVDGQPTSKHFKTLLYDDIVVQASVNTPEMIEKTMSGLEQSYNLGVTYGGRKRMAGTRWGFNDAYATVVSRGTFKLRFHPGTEDGTETGKPVFWTPQIMKQKRVDMGPYNFATQILLNPKADHLQGFKRDWLRTFKNIPPGARMNNYLLVDAASSKKKGSDYTSMWIVRLGGDGNYYCLPLVRDRLNLAERTERLFAIHRKYKPLQIRYEKFGMMADIEHIKQVMEQENYRFSTIVEVSGQTSKDDRIKRLLPLFEQGRIWLPQSLHVTDWQKTTHDLVHDFVEEEYMAFPVGVHDDQLDALSRICEPDLKLVWPTEEKVVEAPLPRNENRDMSVQWMV